MLSSSIQLLQTDTKRNTKFLLKAAVSIKVLVKVQYSHAWSFWTTLFGAIRSKHASQNSKLLSEKLIPFVIKKNVFRIVFSADLF